MNWLITGGCGFIGVNLVKSLVEDGQKVRIVDNFSVGTPDDLYQVTDYIMPDVISPYIEDAIEPVELFDYDITDGLVMKNLCRGMDVVIHLAAKSGVRESVEFPKEWFESNVIGTFNVLEAVRKNNIKKVIMASSSAAVGDCSPPAHEEVPPHPISPYGATKTVMEAYSFAYNYSYGIDTTCLRFSNVYGPQSNHKGSLVAKFIRRLLSGKIFNIYGDGEQTRDFIYTEDLIDAIKLCVKKDVGGEIFQLCTGKEFSVNVVVDKILDYFDFDKNKVVKHIDPKMGDMRTNWADNSKIKKILGWIPTTSFDDGLKETIGWFKRNKNEIINVESTDNQR